MAIAGVAPQAAGQTSVATDNGRPPVVVELFTSQGCSSCPPSDAFLGDLAKRADLVTLSYHVDYWDYIGWADPFASPAYTERQRNYARVLRQRYVYTPEMVVDGIAHDSGMDRGTIYGLIKRARSQDEPRIAARIVDRGADGIVVKLPAFAAPEPCDVWLVTYDPERRTDVTRGENRGRNLVNYNVVRSLTLLTRWDGKARDLAVPADRLGAARGIAILVQHADFGPMVGAASLSRVQN